MAQGGHPFNLMIRRPAWRGAGWICFRGLSPPNCRTCPTHRLALCATAPCAGAVLTRHARWGLSPSIMARHEQISAEIDMHAEVLPILAERLDLVLHRGGQREKPHDPLGVR